MVIHQRIQKKEVRASEILVRAATHKEEAGRVRVAHKECRGEL